MSKIDKNMLKSFKNFLFDCDGVIWKHTTLIPGASKLLNVLKENGKNIFLISNNSTISTEQYIEKCHKLGLNVDLGEVICSSHVLARYLKSVNFTGKVYVVGEEGVSQELNKVGIPNFGVGEENRFFRSLAENLDSFDNDVKAVVVGFDKHFNLTKMTIASTYILHKNCQFIATNSDVLFPTANLSIPGTGSMVQAIATATSRQPLIIGKPYSPMFQMLQKEYGLVAEESIMVGDNLDTDIAFGNEHNMCSLLVFSGVTSKEQLAQVKPNSPQYPKFCCDSVADLIDIFV